MATTNLFFIFYNVLKIVNTCFTFASCDIFGMLSCKNGIIQHENNYYLFSKHLLNTDTFDEFMFSVQNQNIFKSMIAKQKLDCVFKAFTRNYCSEQQIVTQAQPCVRHNHRH